MSQFNGQFQNGGNFDSVGLPGFFDVPQRATDFFEQEKAKDPISSDISRQLAHIAQSGFLKPSRFYFEIEGLHWTINERLVRNCMTTSIPGRALLTQPLKIYGPPVEYAYESNYTNELQMTFRIGSDMFERDFFEGWIGAIFSPMTGDLMYPDSYKTALRIYQLDSRDSKVYCTELVNVFCKAISDIELSTDATDQIETLNVTLSYSEYQVIGKKNFFYDSRKDRGPSEFSSNMQNRIEEHNFAVRQRHQLNSDRAAHIAGDMKYTLNKPL